MGRQWEIFQGNGRASFTSGDNSSTMLSYPQGPHTYTISARYTDSTGYTSNSNSLSIVVNDVLPVLGLYDADSFTNNDYNWADSTPHGTN